MIQFLVLCLLWQALAGSEYYCPKGNCPTNWNEAEKFMNNPGEQKFKLDPATRTTLTGQCEKEDIVIVRRFKVEIASNKATYSLVGLVGEQMEQFMKKGGICHTKYDDIKEVKEVVYSGRGDLSNPQILQLCGYRQLKCGEHVFNFSRYAFDVWCRFDLNTKKWTTYFTKEPLFKVYDNELICEVGEDGGKGAVLCLKEDCSKVEVAEIRDVCKEKKEMNYMIHSYIRTASQWGHEAFKHFIRNYILTLVAYSFFMLQARRSPMVRRELSLAWKRFKSAIDLKEDDESALLHMAKKRERFLYERHKRELKMARKVPVENLVEELKEAKGEISRQAAMVKEEEEGESASNRPPNMSSRLVQKMPLSLSELRSLVQWSWMIESHMIRAMAEEDQVGLLRKSYGLDGTNAFAKLV